jgi:hypothetical protein
MGKKDNDKKLFRCLSIFMRLHDKKSINTRLLAQEFNEMRKIMFRAWKEITEMGKPGTMSYEQEFCHNQIIHNDGIKIMQFTGLTDKN